MSKTGTTGTGNYTSDPKDTIDTAEILNHTHNFSYQYNEAINSQSMNSMPDFSNLINLKEVPVDNNDTLNFGKKRSTNLPVYKINVPGYFGVFQAKRSLDTDFVCQLASHPGYLFWRPTDNYYTKITTSTKLLIPPYWNKRCILFGHALPDGDTYCSSLYPIMPGENTYAQLIYDWGSDSGYYLYNFCFIPCKSVTTSYSSYKSRYVEYCCRSATYITASVENGKFVDLYSEIFSGDWKNNLTTNNTKYIYKLYISLNGQWNTNYDNSGYGPAFSNIGREFHMADATATGTNRVWIAESDHSIHVEYNTTDSTWILGWSSKVMFKKSGGVNSDPWDTSSSWQAVNWTKNTSLPIITAKI